MSAIDRVSRYVYGTTRLGDKRIPFEDRVGIARAAMGLDVWFHASHQYGDALQVLRTAFASSPDQVPGLIFKTGLESAAQVRGQIEEQLETVGRDHLEIAQLCAAGGLARSLREGGLDLDELAKMKSDGLVGGFVLEVFPWTSATAKGVLKGHHADGLVDGYIFYLNPLQRFVDNELWSLLQETMAPIIAMRTVAGGDIREVAQRDPSSGYLVERAKLVLPLFERSGMNDWPAFAASFSLGFSNVRATVGSTSHPERMKVFERAVTEAAPLDKSVVDQILAYQAAWFDGVEVQGEPWALSNAS